MKNSLIFLTAFFLSCVGPSEADHGLVENMPAIINTSSAFSFILRADNYSSENSIELSFSLPEGQNLASGLIVTEYKGNDTTLIRLEDDAGDEIYKYSINGDITELNTSSTSKPKKAIIITKNFTGILDWSVTAD
ncbi:MAG: hypothetical protein CMG37_05860 [Candidatus Marinimicrobia bacterium]|nr:hypothetical protein [Candidatus Neomarinimicrobiota bacterium]